MSKRYSFTEKRNRKRTLRRLIRALNKFFIYEELAIREGVRFEPHMLSFRRALIELKEDGLVYRHSVKRGYAGHRYIVDDAPVYALVDIEQAKRYMLDCQLELDRLMEDT